MEILNPPKKVKVAVCLLLYCLAGAASVQAQIFETIDYQGALSNGSGSPGDGDFSMVFSLYNSTDPSATPLWQETKNVTVAGGVFSVKLGSTVPLIPFTDMLYYLGVKVGTDPEMTPRQAIASVPSALLAEQAILAQGVADNSISTTKIVNGGVNTADLANGAVTDAKVTGPISGAKIGTAGLNADMVDSLHASSFLQSETDPTVNALGKTALSCGNGQTVKWNGSWGCADDNNTTYSAGTGLNLGATTFNVKIPLELTSGISSHIIFGHNTMAGGKGVRGDSSGGNGYGVYGQATNPNGYGVYGWANGSYSTAVGGLNINSSGETYGGHFQADSVSGRGVRGYASATGDAFNYGGHFQSNGNSGTGVYGLANATGSVTNYGGFFQANGNSGRGVFGLANATGSVTNFGGSFQANGNFGRGVQGIANGASAMGVYGFSSNGVGGWFESSSGHGLIVNLGNAGFGTQTPSEKLEVAGNLKITASQPFLILNDSNGSNERPIIRFLNNNGNFDSDDRGKQDFNFYSVWSSNRTNDASVNVFGRATGTWGKFISLTHDGSNGRLSTEADSGHIAIHPGAGVVLIEGNLNVAGEVGINDWSQVGTTMVCRTTSVLATCSSDIRLKKDIRNLSEEMDVLATLDRLHGVKFKWLDPEVRAGKEDVGLIAQEVEEVLPELVNDEANGYKSIDYHKMAAYLVEVNKAQQKRIEAQEERIETLSLMVEVMNRRLAALESPGDLVARGD